MTLCNDFHKDVNGSEALIVFKLTELSRSRSKRINIYFNYLNEAADGEALDLYLKSVQENSVYKEPYFER